MGANSHCIYLKAQCFWFQKKYDIPLDSDEQEYGQDMRTVTDTSSYTWADPGGGGVQGPDPPPSFFKF